MSLSYSIETDAHLVRLVYSGAVEYDEWVTTMKSVFEDGSYRPGFAFLVDRRLALTPTAYFIERAVAFTRRHKSRVAGSRWALVVSNAGTFGMMRLAQMLGNDLVKDSCVFKSLDEAEAWLRDRKSV